MKSPCFLSSASIALSIIPPDIALHSMWTKCYACLAINKYKMKNRETWLRHSSYNIDCQKRISFHRITSLLIYLRINNIFYKYILYKAIGRKGETESTLRHNQLFQSVLHKRETYIWPFKISDQYSWTNYSSKFLTVVNLSSSFSKYPQLHSLIRLSVVDRNYLWKHHSTTLEPEVVYKFILKSTVDWNIYWIYTEAIGILLS